MADPWEHWSAAQIAAVTGCREAPIAEHWPTIYQALEAHAINGRLEQMAAIATVAIETASTFAPVREAFWLTEEYRRDNFRYYPYYGRGFIQLTWDYNYKTYGEALGFDLLGQPDLALDPWVAAMVLARYFVDRQVADAAAEQNWPEVRRRVQGGHAGLERLEQIVADLAVLADGAPEQPDPLAVCREQLEVCRIALDDVGDDRLSVLLDQLAATGVLIPELTAIRDELRRIREQALGPRVV